MFKRVLLCTVFLGMLPLVAIPVAHAISIDFVPANQTVGIGQSVSVDVVVSGLTAANEIVSAFDLDVTYNTAVLTATNVSFGPSLGDPFFFEAFTSFDVSTPGVVDFAELSLLSDASLAALQGNSVTLATLTFNTISAGTSALDFVFNAFNDVKGRNAQVLNLTVGTGSISAVPEPSSMLLLASGLAGLVGMRLYKKKNEASAKSARGDREM